MSPNLRTFIATIILSFVGLSSYAQGGPPPPDTRTTSLPGLVMPIDDHIIVVVMLGILLGVYYAYKHSKRVKVNNPA